MVSFLKKCEVCQQFESSNLVPAGLLQPLPIPRQIWMSISIDFIIGLPRNQEKDTILVVVDRHSKYSHFAALARPSTAKSIAKIYFDKIFIPHGMPTSIICDRDPMFTSACWSALFKLQGVAFNYIPAPSPDGWPNQSNQDFGTIFTRVPLKLCTTCRLQLCFRTSQDSKIRRGG